MENACISKNIGRFSQTNDTPPMNDSLIADISPEEHCQGWKRQKERTAAKGKGLSFSHHKAAAESPTMAEMDRIFRELLYKHGFSPEMWKSITDFEILKKS
jgi:hypothetical protein